MNIQTSQTAPRRVLFLKAKIANQPGYYLHNGRWHAIKQNKPAPKGAPVAAHPSAAGEHAPAKHLTDAEWDHLKLPESNVNSGSFNKLLDKLKGLSESGNVTGILGMQFGTNTYGKKAAKIANHLLRLHGSEHKVSPGQKAGEHEAVKQAPAVPAETAPPAPFAVGDKLKFSTQLEKVNKGEWEIYNESEENFYLKKVGAKVPNATNMVTIPKSVLTVALAHGTVAKIGADEIPATKLKTTDDLIAPKQTSPDASAAPDTTEPEKYPEQSSDLPEFDDTYGKAKFYDKVAAKLKEMADAGDIDSLKAALEENKGTTAWQGKTKNSKILVAYHAELVSKLAGDQAPVKDASPAVAAPGPAKAPADQAPAKKPRMVIGNLIKQKMADKRGGTTAAIDWDSHKIPDSNSNAKSHNGKVDQIKAMFDAGDAEGLEAFKAGKNTYGKKQTKLAQAALAALKDPAQAAPAQNLPKIPKFKDLNHEIVAKKWVKMLQDGNADEMKSSITALAGNAKNNPKLANDKDTAALLAFGLAMMHASGNLPKELSQKIDDAVKFGQPNDGPKEGDTKEGADGTLVFHNGRWHKQNEDKPASEKKAAAEESETGLDAITVPDFYATAQNKKHADILTALANDLLQSAKDSGAGGLKGKVVQHKTGKKAGWLTVKAAGYKATVSGVSETQKAYNDFHRFVSNLLAKTKANKANKAKKPSKAKAAAVPAQEAPKPLEKSIESMNSWKQVGPQAGSNPGGRFKDENGVEWYCKFPSDPDIAKSEVLAANLYAAAGVAAQDAKLVEKDGKLAIASRWIDIKKASPDELKSVDGVASGFAVDAWLANWDVVGMGYDNLQVGADGKAVRIDAGGSLTYRAQGEKKAFGGTVAELDSMRDAKINPQSAAVFSGLTNADITASVAKVAAISDATIRIICATHGPGDAANRKALADLLIARKADLIAKYPKAAKKVKKRLDPESLPVKESDLPAQHDFNNWNGPGKGLSSQPHINAANMAVEAEILEMAKTGNLNKLKEFKFHEIDKSTGNATGKLIPIAQHPSKHVVQFHADLVQLLDEIANPPEPLKIFRETDVGTLDELDIAFPSKPFGTTVSSVSSNEKLGFWVVLGGVHGAEKFKPAQVMDYSKKAIEDAYDKFKEAKPLAKHFVKSVQASGSYNDLFRDGEKKDKHGNLLSDVAKAAEEFATTQPEGTSLYRWQNMPDDMVKKIMSAPDGTVFQATGPMCTSYSPTATSGFGNHRVVIRYAKGAKAVESFGSGSYQTEKEVTTLPNARFVILSKKMVPNEKQYGKQRLELEVLMLPPDLGL